MKIVMKTTKLKIIKTIKPFNKINSLKKKVNKKNPTVESDSSSDYNKNTKKRKK